MVVQKRYVTVLSLGSGICLNLEQSQILYFFGQKIPIFFSHWAKYYPFCQIIIGLGAYKNSFFKEIFFCGPVPPPPIERRVN